MKQYEMFELSFQGKKPQSSEAVIDLVGEFTTVTSDNQTVSCRVKGFYAGNEIYKVRFLPRMTGAYSWKITSSLQLEGALEGTENCLAAADQMHGMVQAQGTHFTYEDGKLFHPFGTTIYALAHQSRELMEQTYQTLAAAPFNKVRHCVFPKFYDYNHNDPQYFAFEKDETGAWDVNRPCFDFWDHFEKSMNTLAELGIQTDLILFHPYDKWGLSRLSREENLIYLDYLLRRFSAYPHIWWSLANEYDLCFSKNMDDWYAFENFIAENDPYHHLLSNHNCFSLYDFHRKNVTHSCVQTTQVESARKWLDEYQKPLMYDECCYEGDLPLNWGNISGFEMANRFWIACAQGAYVTHGEVFLSEDEILWWAKGGVLKGESPKRIAFLRSIIEELPSHLEAWVVNRFEDMDPEVAKVFQELPFEELKKRMPESMQESMLVKETKFNGRCGDQVFLEYLGRHCNRVLDWKLPEERTYQIEVIDMWDMTRTRTMVGVNGKIRINLPGKEGIAVLATAIS